MNYLDRKEMVEKGIISQLEYTLVERIILLERIEKLPKEHVWLHGKLQHMLKNNGLWLRYNIEK